MKHVHFIPFALLVALLSYCAPPPTLPPVTLTAPPATPTVTPVDLSAPMEVGSTFVYVDGTMLDAVPSSPFIMGHGKADNPEHTVTLSDFWIYATEVTNRQYALCVARGECTAPNQADNLIYSDFGGQNMPVVGVTYDQAEAYCNSVNAGLPTEAQWEKAARGPEANLYPWGITEPSCDLLNFNNCLKQTSEVTHYIKGGSYYGALDMEGNVYEWVADWYDARYYENSPPGDPPGPDSGKAHVVRSSGYRSNATQVLAYARSFSSPGDHRRDLGFRCMVKDPTYFAPACQMASVVDRSELASLVVDCPNISIDVQTTACRYGGGAVVTFNDDHPHDPNASFGGIVGCTLLSGTPGSFPLSYQCKKASTAVMSTRCTYAGVGNTDCPAHYSLNATTGACEWDGNRTSSLDCPGGRFYDPVRHCCMISSGNLEDDPVCPVGMVFTEAGSDQYGCLPTGIALNVPAQAKSINPPVCANACNLTADSCSQRNLVLCSTTCTCLAVGVKCPTH